MSHRNPNRLMLTLIALVACLGIFAIPAAGVSAGINSLPSGASRTEDGALALRTVDAAIDTRALAQPTREIRSVVPNGKEDGRFGSVTKRPDGKVERSSTPLAVRLRATKAPKLNEAINVTLQVHAFKDAPGTVAELQLPAGAEVLAGSPRAQFDLAAGQRAEVAATIVFRQAGEHTIQGRAIKTVSEDMVWGDADALYLTVDQNGGRVGHASAGRTQLTARRISAETPNMQIAPLASEDGKPLGDRADEVSGAQQGPGTQITVQIAICWDVGDRDGVSRQPLRDFVIELWDDDAGADDLLNSGHTGYTNGCRTVNVNNVDGDEGGTIDVFWRIWTRSVGRWRVQNFGGGFFFCQTSTTSNVGGNVNYGTWWCGGTGGGNDGSTLIANDLYRTHRFITEHAASGGMGAYPGEVIVQWQPDSTDGTYYSLGDGMVHLAGADSQSRDTVVHEANHRFMHLMYVNWPPFDCPSPHFINGVSGPGCAWSEGYTYAVVAGVDGNPVYTWPGGATLNLETPDCNTASWDDGPTVEGRVGGLLIDLMDPFTISFGTTSGFSNETTGTCGKDQVSGMFDAIWDTIYDQDDQVVVVQGTLTDSFSNAWESRQYPRFAPHDAGHRNSIITFTHD